MGFRDLISGNEEEILASSSPPTGGGFRSLVETSPERPVQSAPFKPTGEELGVSYVPTTPEEKKSYTERLNRLYGEIKNIRKQERKKLAGSQLPQLESYAVGFFQSLLSSPTLERNYAAEAYPGLHKTGYATGSLLGVSALNKLFPLEGKLMSWVGKDAGRSGLVWGTLQTAQEAPTILSGEGTLEEKGRSLLTKWAANTVLASGLFYGANKGIPSVFKAAEKVKGYFDRKPAPPKELYAVADRMMDTYKQTGDYREAAKTGEQLLYKFTHDSPLAQHVAGNASLNIMQDSLARRVDPTKIVADLRETLVRTMWKQGTMKPGGDVTTTLHFSDDISPLQYVVSGLFRRSSEVLRRLGTSGAKIADLIETTNATADLVVGNLTQDMTGVLSKLSAQERAIFAEAVEKGLPANASQALRTAVAAWNHVSNYIRRSTQQAGIKIEGKEFKGLSNYFPHMHDITQLEKAANKMRAAQEMVLQGKAKSVEEALVRVNNYITNLTSKKFGPLEIHRSEAEIPGWITDPMAAIPLYIDGAVRRIASAHSMGVNGEKTTEILGNLMAEKGPRAVSLAKSIIRRSLETTTADERVWNEALRPLRSFMTISKMGLSAIPNVFQKQNMLLTNSFSDVFKAAGGYRSAEAKEFARRAGAILNDSAEIVKKEMGDINDFAGKFLDWVGFRATENGNKVFAAATAKSWAQDLNKQLMEAPANKEILGTLAKIGVAIQPVYERAASGKVPLLNRDMQRIARYLTRKTQFTSDPMALPLLWTSPQGKFLTQFMNFTYNQGILLYDSIITDGVLKGNFGPLITFSTLFPLTGELVGDLRALISGKKRTSVGLQRYFENIGWAGGLGMAGNLMDSIQRGEERILEQILGPGVSTLARGAATLGTIPETGLKEPILFATQQLPIVGTPLTRLLKGSYGK